MKKRNPFAVFLFPSFGRFSTMRSNGLFAPYRRAGRGSKAARKKETCFRKEKVPWNQTIPWNSGRSVIIGLGKIQSYQWFASSKQEVFI